MAATANKLDGFLMLSAIDADWTWTDTFPSAAANGIWVDWIIFSSDTDGDLISIKQGSDAGPCIFPPKPVAGNGDFQLVRYNCEIKPVIDFDQCTLAGTGTVLVKYRA